MYFDYNEKIPQKGLKFILGESSAVFRSTNTRFSLDKKLEKTCSLAPNYFISHRIQIAYDNRQGMNHKYDQRIYSNQFPPL